MSGSAPRSRRPGPSSPAPRGSPYGTGSYTLTRSLPVSATAMRPPGPTSTAAGNLNSPPPLPAPSVRTWTPYALNTFTRWFPVSATTMPPPGSAATPAPDARLACAVPRAPNVRSYLPPAPNTCTLLLPVSATT